MAYYRICEICGDTKKVSDIKNAGITRCMKHQNTQHSIKVKIDNYFEQKRVEGLSKPSV